MNDDNNNQPPQPTWPPAANPPEPPAPMHDPLTPNFSLNNQPQPSASTGFPPPQDPAAPPPPPPAPTWNPAPAQVPDQTQPPAFEPQNQPPVPPFPTSPPQPQTGFNPIPPSPLTGDPTPDPVALDHHIADPGTFPPSNPQPATPPPIPTPPLQPASPFTGPIDSAPTDLSHLIGNTEQPPPPEIYTPVTTQEGTGTPPPPQTPPSNQEQPQTAEMLAPSGSHIGLGKILIIVGVITLLLVSGLSAYFFFGPGKATPSQTSVPAETGQAPLTNPPKQIIEQRAPAPTIAPVATSSASSSFGALGNESSGSAKTGSTAVDISRSRQSPTPTPR